MCKNIIKSELCEQLEHGLSNLGFSCVQQEQKEQLLEFLTILSKWNKVYNLTSVCDPRQMLVRHVLDSLSLLNFLPGQSILDVGTGPGLPGVPLSILSPSKDYVLMDCHQKKVNFVQYVVTSLGISNVVVKQARIEAYKPNDRFCAVVSRAFSSLGDFVKQSRHACKDDGVMIAMRGQLGRSYPHHLPKGYKVTNVQHIQVPGLKAERCLVFVKKVIAMQTGSSVVFKIVVFAD